MSSRRILLMSCLAAALTASTVGAEPPKPREGPLGMKFVSLPKGTFYMGWDGKKGSAKKTEIQEDFEIAVYTVTQGQWQKLMGNNPSYFSRVGLGKDRVRINDEDMKQFPVEMVSSNDEGGFVCAEQAGSVRHARQRVAMVQRPQREGPGSCAAWRVLVQRRQVL